MKKVIIMEEQDRDSLEREHYLVESVASLINRLATGAVQTPNAEEALEKYLAMHASHFRDYEKEKARVSAKYKPEDMPDGASWSVDFERKTITFEVGENAAEA